MYVNVCEFESNLVRLCNKCTLTILRIIFTIGFYLYDFILIFNVFISILTQSYKTD